MKKTHRLVVVSGGSFEWVCTTPIHLKEKENFCDRVRVRWSKVTCKRCLAKRGKVATYRL